LENYTENTFTNEIMTIIKKSKDIKYSYASPFVTN